LSIQSKNSFEARAVLPTILLHLPVISRVVSTVPLQWVCLRSRALV